MKILIYNEGVHDKEDWVKKVYPKGIHGALAEALSGHDVTVTTLDDAEEVVTEERLENTDVMLWWGHCAHDKVSDRVARCVADAVRRGMGIIFLHSAHLSKPFRLLMGTSCTLKWRDDDRERLWVAAPSHPIAAGLPEHFELAHEEMYGEFFDIPHPDETVFIGWFAGGEVFRSGVTFTRGAGHIFYFQPGHESFPTYYDVNIVRVIRNAVAWAAPIRRTGPLVCPNTAALEERK
ncbi:MAG: ThuA domain-containing protein [Eubacteriales bacterium]|nr:ThuA domain-containing protein [Eubacteriales bacterium]